MNLGSDEPGGRNTSPLRRKYSPTYRNGSSPTRSSLDWERSHAPSSFDTPEATPKFEVDPDIPLEPMAPLGAGGHDMDDDDFLSESGSDGQQHQHRLSKGMVIGDELVQASAMDQDEMQRKKEKIMMQSLRRKQQAEENRIRREEEAKMKEIEERLREEEKVRKKEEEKARRDAILEQHRLKKEAEKMQDQVLALGTDWC